MKKKYLSLNGIKTKTQKKNQNKQTNSVNTGFFCQMKSNWYAYFLFLVPVKIRLPLLCKKLIQSKKRLMISVYNQYRNQQF